MSQDEEHYSTREELEEEIWGHSDIYASRRLDVLVSRLRAKLENPEGITIKTHWSNGYCFIHQIEEV